MAGIADAPTVTPLAEPAAWRYELRSLIGSVLKYGLLVLIMLIVLFPIYWMVITGFKTRLELTTYPPTLFPQTPYGGNYGDAFSGSEIPRYMLNSVIVVSISTFISLVFGTLAAYSLARFPLRPHFKQQMSFWILSTRMIPPIVTIIPAFFIFHNLHILNP